MSQTEEYIRETQSERIPFGALALLFLRIIRGVIARARGNHEENGNGQ